MSRKSIIATLGLTVAIASGLLIWRAQVARSESEQKIANLESNILKELTNEDVGLILANQASVDPAKTLSIVHSAETRTAFLKGLKEYLSLAAKARREGLADDPNVKLVLQNKEKGLLTELYLSKADAEGKPIAKITDEQIQEVLADSENVKELTDELGAGVVVQKDTAEKTENPLGVSPPLQGGALEKFRKGWAKAKIISEMAKADADFMQQRSTHLRLKILESGVLSNSCLAKYWRERIKATDNEISSFLASHPEYDLNTKREKAESILARIKAGEDFAALARDFSEHRSTKENGGFYDENIDGPLAPEAKKAALELKPGQLADRVIETASGFEIIQLVDKEVKDGAVSFKLKRILLQKLFEDPDIRRPDIPAPFVTALEIAKAAVQKQKRDSFVNEVSETEKISIPQDFDFEPTEAMKRIQADEQRANELIRKDQEQIKREKRSASVAGRK